MKDIKLMGIVEDIGLGLTDERTKVNKFEVILPNLTIDKGLVASKF